jgi:hypothetical protein
MTDVFKAVVFGLLMFLISAGLVRGSVYQMAFQMQILYPNIDSKMISDRVKDRAFTRGWLISSVVASSLAGVGLYSENEYFGVAAILSGVFLIAGYSGWRGIRDFRQAVKEIGAPWPPSPRDQKWP